MWNIQVINAHARYCKRSIQGFERNFTWKSSLPSVSIIKLCSSMLLATAQPPPSLVNISFRSRWSPVSFFGCVAHTAGRKTPSAADGNVNHERECGFHHSSNHCTALLNGPAFQKIVISGYSWIAHNECWWLNAANPVGSHQPQPTLALQKWFTRKTVIKLLKVHQIRVFSQTLLTCVSDIWLHALKHLSVS